MANRTRVESSARRLGKYEVIARLGKGGMAQVHLAVSRGPGGFNKLVVLKRLESDDESLRNMFLDEARLAAMLQHPNVVHTYEVSEIDGSYFIAMEYLDGQPLDKIIRETKKLGRRLDASLCARIVADALRGLHYTHELCDYNGAPLNVVHRDISPHNLFLTYDGAVKVLDFGVAKTDVNLHATQVGTLKGKLAYMAPEQASGQELDRRTDIFSIGVVLWELLTLERMRSSDTAAGVLNEAIVGQMPDLSKHRQDVSPQLEGILWQALAHYPRRRFQTAQEMRDALTDYLVREPCSQEQAAEFMRRSFGELRERMQRQISACLEQAGAKAPVIQMGQDDGLDRLSPADLRGGSLPLLESGSLPVQHDDATVSLAPDAILTTSEPAPVPTKSRPARSRSPLFVEEASGARGQGLSGLAGWVALTAACALALLWWRDRAPSSTSAGPTPLAPQLVKHEVLLRLRGSNTIGQDLAPRLAEAFLRQQGYANVERGPPGERSIVSGRDPHDGKLRDVEVIALGSSTAFAELASGACDVGLSSRRIKPAEAALLRQQGFGDLESAAGEHVLALDGIAVIVHPNNPLERIDTDVLRRVFTGQVRDFADVGGPPGPVRLYARDDRSGTFDTFKHLVLGEQPIAAGARRLADSAELSSAVARDPQAIGFVGIPYVRAARALSVGAPGAAFLHPSSFTVATEGYGLSRRLYLYIPVEKVKRLALDFVNFALSRAGQDVVRANGFVDLTLHASATGPCESCPGRYAALSEAGRRLSLDFRFRRASAELDNRGLRDLDRLLAFLRENAQSHLVLVGFSDGRGSAAQNARLSLERAKKIATELRERGVPDVDVEAMGSARPVASNDSEDGREKNRRVEVWLR